MWDFRLTCVSLIARGIYPPNTTVPATLNDCVSDVKIDNAAPLLNPATTILSPRFASSADSVTIRSLKVLAASMRLCSSLSSEGASYETISNLEK